MSAKEPSSQFREQLPFTKSTNFSYSLLDDETRSLVEQRTSEIKNLIHRSAQDIYDIGQKLIEVKEKLEHGKFALWLKDEFDWSESTARRFMQVAKEFKSINFNDLKIAASALYLLANKTNPSAARQEALKRAKQGERIDYTKAKSIVSQHQKRTARDLPKQITVDVTAEKVSEEPAFLQDRELWAEDIDLKQIQQRAKELGLLTQSADERRLTNPYPLPVTAVKICTKFVDTVENMDLQLLELMEEEALKVLINKSVLVAKRAKMLLNQKRQAIKNN